MKNILFLTIVSTSLLAATCSSQCSWPTEQCTKKKKRDPRCLVTSLGETSVSNYCEQKAYFCKNPHAEILYVRRGCCKGRGKVAASLSSSMIMDCKRYNQPCTQEPHPRCLRTSLGETSFLSYSQQRVYLCKNPDARVISVRFGLCTGQA
ncbi:uncharacterized protein [Anabrus simplex]|uniref:uncharacterized protein n=1 Tax=Anabrus simplex TaxID=316456 RepID=UPI0035A28AA6